MSFFPEKGDYRPADVYLPTPHPGTNKLMAIDVSVSSSLLDTALQTQPRDMEDPIMPLKQAEAHKMHVLAAPGGPKTETPRWPVR